MNAHPDCWSMQDEQCPTPTGILCRWVFYWSGPITSNTLYRLHLQGGPKTAHVFTAI